MNRVNIDTLALGDSAAGAGVVADGAGCFVGGGGEETTCALATSGAALAGSGAAFERSSITLMYMLRVCVKVITYKKQLNKRYEH